MTAHSSRLLLSSKSRLKEPVYLRDVVKTHHANDVQKKKTVLSKYYPGRQIYLGQEIFSTQDYN